MIWTLHMTIGALAASGLLLSPAIVDTDDGTSGTVGSRQLMRVIGDDDETKTIEIKIVDGKRTVTINGEEVDPDALHVDDGAVLFETDDGSVRFFGDGDGQSFRWRTLSREGGDDMAFGLMELDEPKVMIGIHMDAPGDALCHHLRINPDVTTMIADVVEGLPADKAGLHTFDVIVGVQGREAASAQDVHEAISAREAGDELVLEVIHAGKERRVVLELEAYDGESLGAARRDMTELEFRDLPFGDDTFFFAPGGEGEGGGEWVERFEDARSRYRDAIRVDPNSGQWFRVQRFGDPDEARAHEHEHDETGGDDLNTRIDRLTERIMELEVLLERLLDR